MEAVDVEMLCDVCDETINVRKYEEPSRAYSRHCQSTYHLEIAERFRSIKVGGNDAASSEFFASGDAPQNISSIPANFIESSGLFYCRLCQMNVNDSAEMTLHLKSEKHLMLESFVKDVNQERALLELLGFSQKQTFQAECNDILSYFSKMDVKGKRVCLVCNGTVFADRNYLFRHLRDDENHKLKVNSLFMNRGSNQSFYCIICNVKQVEGAEEHCGGDVHRNAISLLFKFSRFGMF